MAGQDVPRKIGFITFASGQDALDYFHKLTSSLRRNQDLNEVWLGDHSCSSHHKQVRLPPTGRGCLKAAAWTDCTLCRYGQLLLNPVLWLTV